MILKLCFFRKSVIKNGNCDFLLSDIFYGKLNFGMINAENCSKNNEKKKLIELFINELVPLMIYGLFDLQD